MAKSVCSIASPKSCASSSSSSSSASSASSASSTSTRSSLQGDKSLNLKSTSSIDRRKRLAANARERKRMHLLNKAYDELRRRLVDAENKSKYDVLVQAKEYIQALAAICEKFDQQDSQQQQLATVITSGPKQDQQEQAHSPEQDVKFSTKPVDMTCHPPTLQHSSIQLPLYQHFNHLQHHHNLVNMHQRSIQLCPNPQNSVQNLRFT